MSRLLLAGLLVGLLRCTAPPAAAPGLPPPPAPSTAPVVPLPSLEPPPAAELGAASVRDWSGCQYDGPNASAPCTPGATNPDVTQANLAETVCRAGGYTKSIRPPASFTSALKRQQLQGGYTTQPPARAADVEEDHRVPLTAGGAPRAPENLSPEPHHLLMDGTDWGAMTKDAAEAEAHRRLCLPSDDPDYITLAQAQAAFLGDWTQAYRAWLGDPRERADAVVVDEDDVLPEEAP